MKRAVDSHRGVIYENQYIELMPRDKFRDCFFNKCTFTGLGGATFVRCRVINCSSLAKAEIICEQCEIRK